MNAPVSFELVKLLDTKGWKFPYTIEHLEEIQGSYKYYDSIPIVAEVIMWIYNNHKIWISVIDHDISQTMWEFQVSKKDFGLIYSCAQHPAKYCNSPTEAYEEAIEYTLNNLIP